MVNAPRMNVMIPPLCPQLAYFLSTRIQLLTLSKLIAPSHQMCSFKKKNVVITMCCYI